MRGLPAVLLRVSALLLRCLPPLLLPSPLPACRPACRAALPACVLPSCSAFPPAVLLPACSLLRCSACSPACRSAAAPLRSACRCSALRFRSAAPAACFAAFPPLCCAFRPFWYLCTSAAFRPLICRLLCLLSCAFPFPAAPLCFACFACLH